MLEIDYTKTVYVPEQGLVVPWVKKETIPEKMMNRIDRILISEECIRLRVKALAQQICKDYKDVKELYLYGILKGSCTLMADFGRELFRYGGPEVKKYYYKTETYKDEIKLSGETQRKVKILLRPENIKGKNVLLAEDITDQAFTLTAVVNDLIEQGVGQLKVLVLVDKRIKNPSPEVAELKNKLRLDYIGFTVPDRWLAGYDIDAGQDFRHLPFIVAVKEGYYLNKQK